MAKYQIAEHLKSCVYGKKKKKNPKRENGQVPGPGCVRGVVPQVYKDSVPRHISLLTFSFPMQVSCVCFLLIHTLTVPYCFTTQQVKLGHFTFKMSIIQDLDLWSLRFSLYFSRPSMNVIQWLHLHTIYSRNSHA